MSIQNETGVGMTRQRGQDDDEVEWKCLIPTLTEITSRNQQLKTVIKTFVITHCRESSEMPVPNHTEQKQIPQQQLDDSKIFSIFAEYVWMQIFTQERTTYFQADQEKAATAFFEHIFSGKNTEGNEIKNELKNLFKALKNNYEEYQRVSNSNNSTSEDAAMTSNIAERKHQPSKNNSNHAENIPPPFASNAHPADDFRLSEVKKFLKLESFATDPFNPSTRVDATTPEGVTKFQVKQSCWLAYCASKKESIHGVRPADSELEKWDNIYTVVGSAIINYFFEKNNDKNKEPFMLADVVRPWERCVLSRKEVGWASAFVSFGCFSSVVEDNVANLMKLLTANNKHDVLCVARQHFAHCMAPVRYGTNIENLREFYSTRSVVVMSSTLAATTAERFVQPTSETKLLPLLPLTDRVVAPQSDRVNIVCGWSGSGKTSTSTLPLLVPRNVPRSAPPICVVFETSSIFEASDPTFRDPEAARKHAARTYEGFSKLEEGTARDNRAACLLVRGILSAFCRREPEQLTREHVTVLPVITDYKDFFTDEVQQILRGKINTDLIDSNEFRIVIDQVAGCLEFVRVLCRIWMNFRQFLSDVFRVKIEKIFLFAVGSGAELIESIADNFDRNGYALFSVQPSQLFAQLLYGQATTGNQSPNYGLYMRLFKELFVKKEDNTFEARVSTHAARQFVHIVSGNARCAALGIGMIFDFVKVHSSFDFMMSRLSVWSVDIAAAFIRLNGLSASRNPFAEMGNALRIVMSRTHRDLSENEIYWYMWRCGILMDTKRADHPLALNRPRYSMSQSFVTMFLIQMNLELSYDFLSAEESFKYLVANHHALYLILRPDVTAASPLSWKLFDGVKISSNANVDTVVLRHNFTDDEVSTEKVSEGNQNLRAKFQAEVDEWKKTVENGGAVVIIGSPDETPNADGFVLTDGKLFLMQYKYYPPTNSLSTEQVKEEFDKMLTSPQNVVARTLLRECCAVGPLCNDDIEKVEVIASIIVLDRNSLNSFFGERSTQNESFIEAEGRFDKGDFADGNRNYKVNETSSSTDLVEKFSYKKRFISVFSEVPTICDGTSVPLDFSNADTNSELFPVVASSLDKAHLVHAATTVMWERTRSVVRNQ